MKASEVEGKVFLQFKLINRIFMLDLLHIEQVIEVSSILDLPGTQPHFLGLINYDSNIIPVISINSKLGLQETEVTKKSRIIVVSYNGELLGILADEIIKAISLDSKRINELRSFKSSSGYSSFLELDKVL